MVIGAFLISLAAGFTDSFTLDIGNALHNSLVFGPGFGAGCRCSQADC